MISGVALVQRAFYSPSPACPRRPGIRPWRKYWIPIFMGMTEWKNLIRKTRKYGIIDERANQPAFYFFSAFLNSAVSAGRILNKSPTMP